MSPRPTLLEQLSPTSRDAVLGWVQEIEETRRSIAALEAQERARVGSHMRQRPPLRIALAEAQAASLGGPGQVGPSASLVTPPWDPGLSRG